MKDATAIAGRESPLVHAKNMPTSIVTMMKITRLLVYVGCLLPPSRNHQMMSDVWSAVAVIQITATILHQPF